MLWCFWTLSAKPPTPPPMPPAAAPPVAFRWNLLLLVLRALVPGAPKPGFAVCARAGPLCRAPGRPVSPPIFFGPLLICAHFYDKELFKAEKEEFRLLFPAPCITVPILAPPSLDDMRLLEAEAMTLLFRPWNLAILLSNRVCFYSVKELFKSCFF